MAKRGFEPASTDDLRLEAQLVVRAADLARPRSVVLCCAPEVADSGGGSVEGVVGGWWGRGWRQRLSRSVGSFWPVASIGGLFRTFWLRLPLAATRGQRPLTFFGGTFGGVRGTNAFFLWVRTVSCLLPSTSKVVRHNMGGIFVFCSGLFCHRVRGSSG